MFLEFETDFLVYLTVLASAVTSTGTDLGRAGLWQFGSRVPGNGILFFCLGHFEKAFAAASEGTILSSETYGADFDF